MGYFGIVVSNLAVRRAGEYDALAIAAVLRQAFAEFEPKYTAAAFAATTPDVAMVLERLREGPVWVAVHDDQIVGTVAVVSREQECYIRGMGVLPGARARGAGRQLLAAVEAFALESGAERMFLSTTPFLHRAIQLYERNGFRRTPQGPHDLWGTPLFTMVKNFTVKDQGP